MKELEIRNDTNAERFVASLPGEEAAVLEYETVEEGVLDLKHTMVPEEHRGSGVGHQLVRHVLDQARSEGTKVIPTCPFVAEVMGEDPAYQDLVVAPRTPP